MDVGFMMKYYPLYVEAAKLTLRLGAWGIFFSIIIGLICALTGYYRIPVFRRIVAAYIELSRNTPLLVQLFFLYFGLPKAGVMISSEGCAVLDHGNLVESGTVEEIFTSPKTEAARNLLRSGIGSLSWMEPEEMEGRN